MLAYPASFVLMDSSANSEAKEPVHLVFAMVVQKKPTG
jgi:hypothetical protein